MKNNPVYQCKGKESNQDEETNESSRYAEFVFESDSSMSTFKIQEIKDTRGKDLYFRYKEVRVNSANKSPKLSIWVSVRDENAELQIREYITQNTYYTFKIYIDPEDSKLVGEMTISANDKEVAYLVYVETKDNNGKVVLVSHNHEYQIPIEEILNSLSRQQIDINDSLRPLSLCVRKLIH